jgi:hypothetical protein
MSTPEGEEIFYVKSAGRKATVVEAPSTYLASDERPFNLCGVIPG